MRIFLPLLCVLCVPQVHSIFDRTCIRKDPPPGVLVLSPGSKLVLTCRGHVRVNGLTVKVTRKSSDTNRRGSPSAVPTTTGSSISKHTMGSTANELYLSNSGVSTVTGKIRSPKYTDTDSTASTASSATHTVHPTSVSRLLKKREVDYEEEEEEEGEEENRVTRGINSSPKWKWNGKMVGKAKRDWGDITFESRGATLSLSSVRLADSGNYTCHQRGREMFSLKVIVAGTHVGTEETTSSSFGNPPETPSLSCYKRSPSSKVRCEWEPKKPITRPHNCYLLFSKRSSTAFDTLRCSYSSRLSRYWSALDNNEDELRTLHTAYLCLTSIAGNVTSSLLSFIPLNILKPDPPSDVKVKESKGKETYIKVTWNFPISWKSEDSYYKLIYEIKYKPLASSYHYEQIRTSLTQSSEITDAMPGVDYQIQVRTKEEYDGLWSDWSTPVIGRSWTEPIDVYASTLAVSTEEGSAFMPGSETTDEKVSYHTLWISGCFLLLSVILAAYIFSHRDRFMPKLHHLFTMTQHSDLSQPPPPSASAPEVQALVTFTPPRYKEPPLSQTEEEEEKNEEEQSVQDRIEAMHFNNPSYFLLQAEYNM